MWYDLASHEYAKGLRFSADRSDEGAIQQDLLKDAWAPDQAAYMRGQSRRLRAMAILCDQSSKTRAGDIDFRGLSSAAMPREIEDEVVLAIERGS